jgi:glutathione S-transferase
LREAAPRWAADPAILEKEIPNFHKLAGFLDERLAHSKWLCGDSQTIADIAVASAIHLHQWQKLPLSQHKHLARWMTENAEQLPCWKNTMVYEGFTLQKQAA